MKSGRSHQLFYRHRHTSVTKIHDGARHSALFGFVLLSRAYVHEPNAPTLDCGLALPNL